MRRNIALYTLALTLAVSPIAFAQAPAGTPAAPTNAPAPTGASKIGIVDVQAAIVSTNEGQKEFQALQKKFDPTKVELEGLQKEVEDLKKQLSTQGDKLNDEARNSLVKQVDSKQKLLQRKYEDANNDLTAQQNDIANRIGQKMMEVLDKYARANNYGVVLNVSGQQNPVIWASQPADLTQAIVEAYNAQSNVPAQAGAAPAAGARPGAAKPAAARPAAPKPATPKQ
jgi:outer membrane protein